MRMSRRTMLMWLMVMAVGWVRGGKGRAWADSGQAPQSSDDQAIGMTMDIWMTEWMSLSRTPGGLLRLARFREPVYFLTAPISWTPNPDQGFEPVTVPTGFVTDLASIPRAFWSLLRPDGEYAHAAVVHDYLYWTQTRPRDEADAIFKIGMEEFEIDFATRTAIYGAVRVGGALAWKGNAEKKGQGEKRLLKKIPQDPRTRWEDWKKRPDVFAE